MGIRRTSSKRPNYKCFLFRKTDSITAHLCRKSTLATSTIKSNQATTIAPVITLGEHCTVATCRCRYTNNGIAQIVAQFHITEDTANNEVLFSVGNVKPPKVNMTTPTVSSADKTKYGNINFTTGAAFTSGGSLPTSDWYAVNITYVY